MQNKQKWKEKEDSFTDVSYICELRREYLKVNIY